MEAERDFSGWLFVEMCVAHVARARELCGTVCVAPAAPGVWCRAYGWAATAAAHCDASAANPLEMCVRRMWRNTLF